MDAVSITCLWLYCWFGVCYELVCGLGLGLVASRFGWCCIGIAVCVVYVSGGCCVWFCARLGCYLVDTLWFSWFFLLVWFACGLVILAAL